MDERSINVVEQAMEFIADSASNLYKSLISRGVPEGSATMLVGVYLQETIRHMYERDEDGGGK